MTTRPARVRVPSTVALFLLCIGGMAMGAVWDSPPYATPSDIYWGFSTWGLATVGLVLALRVRGNSFGWLLMVGTGGLGWGVAFFELGTESLGDNLFGVGIITFMVALLVFPTGRYLTRLWMGAQLAAIASILLIPHVAPSQDSLGLLILAVVTAVGLLVRWVRGSPVRRRQIGLPFLVLGFGVLVNSVVGSLVPQSEWLASVTTSLITVGFPVSILVAVLRFRLFELDRVISRTVGYGLVVALLGLAYALGAVWLPSQFSGDSSLFVAGSTLAVAALFNPLRRRILRGVDRRFYRTPYDAERVVEQFSAKLRNKVDVADLAKEWVSAVEDTMHPAGVGVWLRKKRSA